MGKEGFLLIGKIVGVHGVKGNVKVFSHVESMDFFAPESPILAIDENGRESTHVVAWAKPHQRLVLLSLKGVSNRDLAEAIVGSEIFVENERLPALEDGTYYWSDIIGLEVYSKDDQYIGRVDSIIATGSNDVYVVKKPPEGKNGEVLIPALETVVIEIDLNRKIMRVDLPDGL